MIALVLVLFAVILTAMIPGTSESDQPQQLMLIPLILLGVGYSIYAATIWGCIPFTMPAKLVGTAYGLSTCCQNIGLIVSPQIAAFCLNTPE